MLPVCCRCCCVLLVKTRLRELAQDLLGPVRWCATWGASSAWSPRLLGRDKRGMLAALVLPAMAEHGLGSTLQVSEASGCSRAQRGAAASVRGGGGGCGACLVQGLVACYQVTVLCEHTMIQQCRRIPWLQPKQQHCSLRHGVICMTSSPVAAQEI